MVSNSTILFFMENILWKINEKNKIFIYLSSEMIGNQNEIFIPAKNNN